MSSNKKKISVVLAAFSLFNSYGFAAEKSGVSLNKKLLRENKKVKGFNHIKSKSVDNSNWKWKLYSVVFGATALLEGGYIYKQHTDNEETIKNNEKQYNITLNAVEQALREAKANMAGSQAFSRLTQKYTFKHQLYYGRQATTAVFTDQNGEYYAVKTLFKSGDENDIKEIQKEKKAVEFLKNKPKNKHMVFPIECFEDDSFLFVVYPYVSPEAGVKRVAVPYMLNNFKAIIEDNKQEFKKWDDNKKKKLIWHIAKQLFEVYKYFYENKFFHGDLKTNILVQLQKTNNIDYSDFTIKVIDWGIWRERDCKLQGNQEYPYQPVMTVIGSSGNFVIKNLLVQLYRAMNLTALKHDDKCKHHSQCSTNSFLSGLEKFIGCDSSGLICSALPGEFRTGEGATWVYDEWAKSYRFAQNFDELINFCQEQIDSL